MSNAQDTADANELVQGTDEWHAARCGKITSSCFGKLAGKGRSGGWTQTAITYMNQVVAERLTGVPQDEIQNKYIDHGHTFEPIARQMYQLNLADHAEVKEVGFCEHPTIPFCGGSPDCLVGSDGLVEIKCPYNVHQHLAHIEADGTDNKEYIWQMQGNMWVTGRKWCDFVSFHPFVPQAFRIHVVRYERDEDVIEELEERVPRALEQIEIRLKNLESKVRLSAQ